MFVLYEKEPFIFPTWRRWRWGFKSDRKFLFGIVKNRNFPIGTLVEDEVMKACSYRPVCLEAIASLSDSEMQLKSTFEQNLSWTSWGMSIITSVIVWNGAKSSNLMFLKYVCTEHYLRINAINPLRIWAGTFTARTSRTGIFTWNYFSQLERLNIYHQYDERLRQNSFIYAQPIKLRQIARTNLLLL